MTEVEQLREALRQKNELIEDLERRFVALEEQCGVCPTLKQLRKEVTARTAECDFWLNAYDAERERSES